MFLKIFVFLQLRVSGEKTDSEVVVLECSSCVVLYRNPAIHRWEHLVDTAEADPRTETCCT